MEVSISSEMAVVLPTPQGDVKKKSKMKPQQQQREKLTECILCREAFSRREAHKHMHGMPHHRELESALGRDVLHECQACKVYAMTLCDYTKHISTPLHRAKLQGLMSRNTKPVPLIKTLSNEAIALILERNKTLRKEEKKQKGKEKKKQKQIAAQKHVEEVQESTKKSTGASNVVKIHKSKEVNQKTEQQMQQTLQKGRSNVVVQNKENKEFSVTQQNQSGRLAGSAGQPAGRPLHRDHVREQLRQPGCHTSSYTSSHMSSHMGSHTSSHTMYQTRYNENLSDPNQRVNVEHSQTWRSVNRPHNTYDGARTDMSEQRTWPDNRHYDDYYSKQYRGATLFDHNPNERPRSSQQGQESSHQSSSTASANSSSGAAPLRETDVGTMLKQVRRALGVREPCRADREAKRKNSEASDRVADRSTTQQTGAAKGQPSGAASTSVQDPQVTFFEPAAPSGVCPSNVAPATPKQTTVEVTQEMNGCAGIATSSEQSNPKVRIAHKPRRSQAGKEAKRKSINSSEPKNKQSWSEMYNERKREKQVSVKRKPRLRIESSNPPPPEHRPDPDLPLSEGFHWESIPVSASETHLTLPRPAQDTTEIDSHRDEQTGSLLQEPGTSDQGASSHTVTAAPVNVEPSVELENGGLSRGNKRKLNNDEIPKKVTNRKKRRTITKKDQGQMDQLLAVSLREDELSHSLQDLDISLIQARSALQVAYAEVQRILFLREQFSAEVKTLRAIRIEILQGMQEGFSGASHITTASSADVAAPLQPRHSPLPSSSAFLASSSQQRSATTSASPISHPRPTPTRVKEEATALQAGQFVSSSTDAPHVPPNQPVPSFPSELPPSLLLRPSHPAAPTTSAAAASTSVNTRLQQWHESREASKDCVRATDLPAWMILSDIKEEAGGNLGRKAADKPFPEIVQNASTAALVNDDGNESDDSVKMMEPPKPVVITIDESDDEDLHKAVPDVSAHPEQQVSNVELSSAGTQTIQQKEVDRKTQIYFPVKAEKSLAEFVDEEELSLGEFLGHTGPVHGMQVHGSLLYTCSGDNTARAYCLRTRECKAVFQGHSNKVNCLLVSLLPHSPTARLYTGSSDQTIRCYSAKSNKCLQQTCLPDRVLCLHIAWNTLYAGLANGSVVRYDLRTLRQLDVFECHGPRGVSCMGTSQEGACRMLLVGSYDSTISVRDAETGLLLRSLEGHTKTVLCMKVVNDLVFSGSSDTSVHAHNFHTGELLRIYKGHGHAVTSIVILGKLMVTACLDQLVRVYELQSHDCLQVYKVHSDMVMCMTLHKSVIYTGCYDGSVQAVKLNLLKNYRCWWQNCSLIFGVEEHLLQHLVRDHSKPSLHMAKCRWRGCDKFFSTQVSVQQKLPDHMQNHVKNDSEVEGQP